MLTVYGSSRRNPVSPIRPLLYSSKWRSISEGTSAESLCRPFESSTTICCQEPTCSRYLDQQNSLQSLHRNTAAHIPRIHKTHITHRNLENCENTSHQLLSGPAGYGVHIITEDSKIPSRKLGLDRVFQQR